MGKQVTLIDIAKVCGTSNVTVSKALSNKKGVSEQLRQKIKETAEKMGYVPPHPDAGAKGSRMIGVLIPERFMTPNGSFYWGLYGALVNNFKRRGYFCLIEQLSAQEEEMLVLPRSIEDGRISALVSLGQPASDYVAKLSRSGIPMIMLDYYIADSDIDSVVTNGYVGGYELASYLIRLGHRDIGFIGTVKATSSIFDRYMGYMKAMLENGIPVHSEWTLDDRETGGLTEIVFPDKLPTAFVCNCDETAYHAIRQLETMGLNVPDDISIVGYDNYLISEVCKPAITTINVDFEQMAHKAAETLLDRIEQPDRPPVNVTISGELIEKESVKCLDR